MKNGLNCQMELWGGGVQIRGHSLEDWRSENKMARYC